MSVTRFETCFVVYRGVRWARKRRSYMFETCSTVYRGVHSHQRESEKFIAERNAHKGAIGSSSSDVDVPSTPATETPTEKGTGGPGESAAQDGVEN